MIFERTYVQIEIYCNGIFCAVVFDFIDIAVLVFCNKSFESHKKANIGIDEQVKYNFKLSGQNKNRFIAKI